MRINLRDEELARYREVRKQKMRFQMPDKRIPTVAQRIRVCRLTPRQLKKMEEMEGEGS